jgi:hypothetical protein
MKASTIGRRISTPVNTVEVIVRCPGYRPLARSLSVGFLQIRQDLPAGQRIALPCLAQFDGSGGSVQQRNADTILQESDRPTHRGSGAAGFAAGPGKTAFIKRRDENFHGIQTVHYTPPRFAADGECRGQFDHHASDHV